jgi:hypothetical protein
LGRPTTDADQLKEQQKLQRQDELDRIAVEGKFGQGKRRFSLGRIMTKLAQTSEVSILITFIVMNLEKILTGVLSFWLFLWHRLSVWMRQNTPKGEIDCLMVSMEAA